MDYSKRSYYLITVNDNSIFHTLKLCIPSLKIKPPYGHFIKNEYDGIFLKKYVQQLISCDNKYVEVLEKYLLMKLDKYDYCFKILKNKQITSLKSHYLVM